MRLTTTVLVLFATCVIMTRQQSSSNVIDQVNALLEAYNNNNNGLDIDILEANNGYNCCLKKTVGDKTYTLKKSTESLPDVKCKDGCIYEEDGTTNRFCFSAGSLSSTCGANGWKCQNPEGNPDEKTTVDGQQYICTNKGWKPIGCPMVIEIDYVVYRFFDNRLTPCKGNINQCVYMSHWQEFCMNGNYPIVTPYRLPFYGADFANVAQDAIPTPVNVTTYLNSTTPGDLKFNMDTTSQPVRQYTWTSRIFESALLCTGFDWIDYRGNERPAIGNTDPGDSIVVPVATGDISTYGHITQVVGRTGAQINRVEFAVQRASDPTDVSTYTCGGIYGGYKDATPKPHKYGRCYMINIAGTTRSLLEYHLASLEFTWFCEGK